MRTPMMFGESRDGGVFSTGELIYLAEQLEEFDPTAWCHYCKELFRTQVCPTCQMVTWTDGGGVDGRCPQMTNQSATNYRGEGKL